jgi:hypothetical protein
MRRRRGAAQGLAVHFAMREDGWASEHLACRYSLRPAGRTEGEGVSASQWTGAALAEHSLELNPTDPLAWLDARTIFFRLGRAYDAFDRPAEAAQAYEALLRPRPKLSAVHRRVAEVDTTQIRDPATAQVHLRQAEGAGIHPGTGS